MGGGRSPPSQQRRAIATGSAQLFDLGYVTIRPDMRFAVSRRLRDEFANGRVYYELDGRQIQCPAEEVARPNAELLAWHGSEVFQDR